MDGIAGQANVGHELGGVLEEVSGQAGCFGDPLNRARWCRLSQGPILTKTDPLQETRKLMKVRPQMHLDLDRMVGSGEGRTRSMT